MSNFYFFYESEAASKWHVALATERERIVAEQKPELVSILDVDFAFDRDFTIEDKAKFRYKGPMYFDFDDRSIADVIPQFQAFLTSLKAKGVNLDSLRLYCSGGKGFHCEMPTMMFMGKMPPQGITALPHIYKEMAAALYVESLDLRVYSSGKGRMWRCPNIERKNGTFKVQITAADAFAMTPERYAHLVSAPRPVFPVAPPEYTPDIGLIYSTAKDKVDAAVKAGKGKKRKSEELKRFSGQWPETLKGLLDGTTIDENVGWNKICIQLAIVAHALGKSEEEFIADAGGLVTSYSGDSDRYGTPGKRRYELRDKYRYMQDNPCYDYSAGGILSLVKAEARPGSDLNHGDYVPDEAPGGEEGATPSDDDDGQIRISKSGIFARSDFGWRRICDMGFSNVVQLRTLTDEVIGYEADLHVETKPVGREYITLNAFMSKTALQTFTMKHSVSMQGNDMHASMLSDVLRRRVTKMNDITYTIQSEGIDLVILPGTTNPDDYEIVWSSPSGIVSPKGTRYRYRPTLDNKGSFNSDLVNAPDLTPDDAEMVSHLLEVNTPENVAKLLGWFSSAFLCPLYRRFFAQYPSLQLYGQAGAGKSKTTELLNHLNFYLVQPTSYAVAGQTHFPIICALAGSSSIPVIFEELKPRELSKYDCDFMRNIFRTNYNANSLQRGSISRDSGKSEVVVNKFTNRAPVVFIGEAIEAESAVLERCVIVSLAKQDKVGRDGHYKWLVKNDLHNVGKIGKALMMSSLQLDVNAFRREFEMLHDTMFAKITRSKKDDLSRPVFNVAVAAMGLRFLQQTLRPVFGARFDEQLDAMQELLIDGIDRQLPENKSEAARVLDVMAQLTRVSEPEFKLVRGRDYTVVGDHVDIKLKPAFAKYVRYTRSLGQTPLFDNDMTFISGMFRYHGVIAHACHDNTELFDNLFEVIYRFSAEKMAEDKIEPFKE